MKKNNKNELVKDRLIDTLENIIDTSLFEVYDDQLKRLRPDLPANKLACIKDFKSKEHKDIITLHSKMQSMQLLAKLINKDDSAVYGKFQLCNFDDFFPPPKNNQSN